MLIFGIFEVKAAESSGERRQLLDDTGEGAGTDAAQFTIAQVSQSCPLVWRSISLTTYIQLIIFGQLFVACSMRLTCIAETSVFVSKRGGF
jgi:hypothetical protein